MNISIYERLIEEIEKREENSPNTVFISKEDYRSLDREINNSTMSKDLDVSMIHGYNIEVDEFCSPGEINFLPINIEDFTSVDEVFQENPLKTHLEQVVEFEKKKIRNDPISPTLRVIRGMLPFEVLSIDVSIDESKIEPKHRVYEKERHKEYEEMDNIEIRSFCVSEEIKEGIDIDRKLENDLYKEINSSTNSTVRFPVYGYYTEEVNGEEYNKRDLVGEMKVELGRVVMINYTNGEDLRATLTSKDL